MKAISEIPILTESSVSLKIIDIFPILCPPDAKSQLIGRDSDAGKDLGQEKGTTER